MSFFSWLVPTRKPQRAPEHSSGLSRLDSTKPFNAARHAATAQPANRKQERMARRELLYGVVREAMVRAGVLSSSYKFKVLSLDARGRQFLVMVDLARGGGAETSELAEIEATIAQSAKARHDILVSAVYWRSNDHVAVGDPAVGRQARPQVSRPAPLAMPSRAEPDVSAPAPLFEAGSPPLESPRALATAVSPSAESHRASAAYDPLQPDEVAAFKRALAQGVSGREAVAAGSRGMRAAPRSYALLTGFEDTEMAPGSGDAVERLSGSQYGDLR